MLRLHLFEKPSYFYQSVKSACMLLGWLPSIRLIQRLSSNCAETGPSQESPTMRYRDKARQGQVGPALKPKAADLIHDPRLLKLFKLLEQGKFAELRVAHEELREAHVDVQQMDVYQYSKLLTQCVTHVGPETALPVFELMVQVGVVPNVVPYTIVIRALMELAVGLFVWNLVV